MGRPALQLVAAGTILILQALATQRQLQLASLFQPLTFGLPTLLRCSRASRIFSRHVMSCDVMLCSARNTGGFDMLGSGRDKIETKEQMEASKKVRCGARATLKLLPLSWFGGSMW